MRQSVAELERSSGKKGAVPITVRQLEAVIRIAGKFADRRQCFTSATRRLTLS